MIVWKLTIDDAHLFIEVFNSIHPDFKFTSSVTYKECTFLDVKIMKSNDGILSTDIFYKPTDSYRYLHFYSYHPRHIKRNIPYALATRIKRIVSEDDTRFFRLMELQSKLLKLKYPQALISG